MEKDSQFTFSEYQQQALRTEAPCTDDARVTPEQAVDVRLSHGALGLADEAGELCKEVKARLFYRKPGDKQNVAEELGDALWYIALAADAVGLDLGQVAAANIAKLRARYPDKFETELAAEENRDRDAEQAAASEHLTYTRE